MPQSKKEPDVTFFRTFSEYWHFARCMTSEQRDVLFKSLPHEDRRKIRSSFKQGGWIDLMMRNKIDLFLDHIKNKFGYDLIEIRSKVLRGKSVYLPLFLWEYIVEEIKLIDDDGKHAKFILGGVRSVVCKSNNQAVLILPDVNYKNKAEEE